MKMVSDSCRLVLLATSRLNEKRDLPEIFSALPDTLSPDEQQRTRNVSFFWRHLSVSIDDQWENGNFSHMSEFIAPNDEFVSRGREKTFSLPVD